MRESFWKWMRGLGYARKGIGGSTGQEYYVMMDKFGEPQNCEYSNISLLGWKLKYLLFYGMKVEIDWSADIYDIIDKVDRRIENMVASNERS